MTPETIKTLNEAASSLTIVGFFLVLVWMLISGKLNTGNRLDDWKERALKAEQTIERFHEAMLKDTENSLKLAISLDKLTERINELARIIEHEKR